MAFISTGPRNRQLGCAKVEVAPSIMPAPLGPLNSSFATIEAVGTPGSFEVGRKGLTVRPLGGWTKRSLDITLALTLLVLLAPLMLTVAFLIRVTSPGVVVFSQRRIGLKGRAFACFKFRTMVPNAKEQLRDYLHKNPEAAREWREYQKLRNDPRVTSLGLLLRRSSIDELPQLINVLRGEMSLIGPRPIVASELDRYGKFSKYYLQTRPGITGLWQVSGRSRRTYKDRVALDRYYVQTWSIFFDCWILFRTIPAVLRFDDAA